MNTSPNICSNTKSLANPEHPGWKLSRACICDTLQTKREGTLPLKGLARSLYNWNVRSLRDTQFSPHAEQKMHEGRFLDKQILKRAAPEIIVVVRGGMVQEVRATNPYTHVLIADYDTQCDDSDELMWLEEAEERGTQPDMHTVY